MSAPKVSVFVDVNNLFHTVKKKYNDRRLDYDALYGFLGRYGTLSRVTAYGFENRDESDGFKSNLRSFGYEINYRKSKQRTVENPFPNDWNVGIAMDVMRMIGRVDTVVLCTSNPNMLDLVKFIKEQGVRCIVVGCSLPKSLKKEASDSAEIFKELLIPERELNGNEMVGTGGGDEPNLPVPEQPVGDG